MNDKIPIILASSSPARKELLNQINIIPDQIIAPEIDESSKKREKPEKLAQRLAYEKAHKVALNFDCAVIIAADTVAVSRGVLLPKAENDFEVAFCLKKISGVRHRVITALCILKKQNGETKIFQRLVKSNIKLKKLNADEIKYYCSLKEGIGKAGGYTLKGYMESFVSFISGSYSNVLGLPLYETRNILQHLEKKNQAVIDF